MADTQNYLQGPSIRQLLKVLGAHLYNTLFLSALQIYNCIHYATNNHFLRFKQIPNLITSISSLISLCPFILHQYLLFEGFTKKTRSGIWPNLAFGHIPVGHAFIKAP